MMKLLIQTENKTYSIKKQVIETLAGLGFLGAFLTGLAFMSQLAEYWGIAEWQ